MNRSAKCITMLCLLKSRGFMTRDQLALELQVNKRNILDYKKELECAGYEFESSTGKYGGYRLKKSTLLPVLAFHEDEYNAIKEASRYLKSHSDFIMYPQFQKAMDKVHSTTNMESSEYGIYMDDEQPMISNQIKLMIQTCVEAKNEQKAVSLWYQSMNASAFEKILIHPYEILNYKGAYYCLAYSLKAKDYRNFKFSEERMKDVSMTQTSFMKDKSFAMKDHIGNIGLIKGDVYELELLLFHETALLIAEKRIGLHPIMEWIDKDTLRLKTLMEGKYEVIKFILSLGNQCELVSPLSLKEEIGKIIKDMYDRYYISN